MKHEISVLGCGVIYIDNKRVFGSKPYGLFSTVNWSATDEDLKRIADRCLELIADRKTDPQKIYCPKCGNSDYVKDLEKDFGVKDDTFKYKCINCNTYIKDEPQKSCSTCGYSPQTPSCDTCEGYSNWWSLENENHSGEVTEMDEPQMERSE